MDDDQVFDHIIMVMLVLIHASSVTAPDIREVLHHQPACAKIDVCGISEVAKALCGAACCYKNGVVGTCIES